MSQPSPVIALRTLFVLLAFWRHLFPEQILAIACSTCAIEIFLALCDTPFLYLSRKVEAFYVKLKLNEFTSTVAARAIELSIEELEQYSNIVSW